MLHIKLGVPDADDVVVVVVLVFAAVGVVDALLFSLSGVVVVVLR